MQHIFDQYKTPFKLCEAHQLCPELVRNRRQVVHGYGDRNADFVFIGETPGEKGANLTGVPFTQDRSGKRLQHLLIQLGLSKETDEACESPRLINCYVTNLVRCNPPRNRNPTKGESENCQPYLYCAWPETALLAKCEDRGCQGPSQKKSAILTDVEYS